MTSKATVLALREYETKPISLHARSRDVLEQLPHFVTVSRADGRGTFDVTASHWVGSLVLPDGYIHVSPKVGGANALRMMLEGDGGLPESWNDSLARIENSALWDALAIALGREMSAIRAAGYHGAYLEEEDNRACVRGKVLPIEDFRFNTPLRRGVYSRDAVWSFDIPVNQALNWASSSLTNLARVDALHGIQAESSLLAGIGEIAPAPDWLPETGDRYRRAIFLAQMVRKAWAPKSSPFGFMSQSAIVNMNNVFEAFVRARLARTLASYKMLILEKGTYRRRFSRHVQVEPDLVIAKDDGKIVAIGDVKYKWKWKFENGDVFQMNAYLDTYPEASTTFVFYPSDGTTGSMLTAETLPRAKSIVPVALDPARLFEEEYWKSICTKMCEAL